MLVMEVLMFVSYAYKEVIIHHHFIEIDIYLKNQCLSHPN